MTEAGFVLAGLIGITLGALGGGGSILMVPALVYGLGFGAKQAIAMSLPIVALTSAAGAISHWRSGHVQLRPAVLFGVLAMMGAYAGAWIGRIVPAVLQLGLLALLMLAAGVLMLRPSLLPIAGAVAEGAGERWLPLAGVLAVAVGVLTGLVGIGGGFLFVPVLVLLVGVPMHCAVGTSLVVIALNAVAGLAGYAGFVQIPWSFVLLFAATASAGAIGGVAIARRTPPGILRRTFGVLLLAVAGAVLIALIPWPLR